MGSKDEIGKAIKYYREMRSMTQAQLAEAIGCSPSAIAMYETGKREPDNDTIESIADVLNIRIANIDADFTGPKFPDGVILMQSLTSHRIPIVGSVAAGEPIYDEEYDAYVDGPLKADCALKVKGESMVPTFQDGDLLYVRIQPDVDYDGQVAAVIVGEEATVKHVYRQEEGLMLLSDNPKYPPMFKRFADYDDQIRVLGKVIGFTRLWE